MADLALAESPWHPADHGARKPRASPITRGFLGLMGGGKLGRELALQADLARVVGPGAVLRAHRRDGRYLTGDVDAAVYRRIWEHAAAACGASITSQGRGFFEIGLDGRRTVVCRNLVKLDDIVTVHLALDKPLVQAMAVDAGLAVPAHAVVRRQDWRSALGFLDRYAPCVVKPATNTAGGTGVTGNVVTADDLARASIRAGRYDELLLVEQQVVGDEYRFLLLDGEPLDVLHRTPPAVVGDGRSTVRALIRAENEQRRAAAGARSLSPIHVDLDCVLTLRRAGIGLDCVPAASIRVAVKSSVNESGASDSRSVSNHPAGLLDAARRAARVLGARFCSVELIAAPDGAGEATAVLIEINGTPGLHYHYQVGDAEQQRPVAVPLLATLLGIDPPEAS